MHPDEQRFWTRVSKASGCWQWTGFLNHDGYGRAWMHGKHVMAHRFTYEALVGPIPAGLVIDHLCRNRSCVNPAHLEPVTLGTNLHRGDTITSRNAAKTHCPQGHPYSPENTYTHRVRGDRHCRTCIRHRKAEQFDTINAARRALGMTHEQYRAEHGQAITTARRILATCANTKENR